MDESPSCPLGSVWNSMYSDITTVKINPQKSLPRKLGENVPQSRPQAILSIEDSDQVQNKSVTVSCWEFQPARMIDKNLNISKQERNKMHCANWRRRQKEKDASLQNDIEALKNKNLILRKNYCKLLAENIQLKHLLLKHAQSYETSGSF